MTSIVPNPRRGRPLGHIQTLDEAAAFALDERCIEDANGCWVYQGKLTPKGYARMRAEGRVQFAYWITWRALRGDDIPDGITYDHLCANKACINPWHGDLVPAVVNARRHHARQTTCKRGHPWTDENTYWNPGGNGRKRFRQCRTCLTANRERRESAA